MLVSCDPGGHDGVVVVALVSRWLWSSWSSRRSITVCVYKNIHVGFLGGLVSLAGGEGGVSGWDAGRLGELWEGEGGGLEVSFLCMKNIPFPLNPFPWPLYIPFTPFFPFPFHPFFPCNAPISMSAWPWCQFFQSAQLDACS